MVGDMWHMKGSRTAPLGKVDDQRRTTPKTTPKASPYAGRNSDPAAPSTKALRLKTASRSS